jgi:hypothetical protein
MERDLLISRDGPRFVHAAGLLIPRLAVDHLCLALLHRQKFLCPLIQPASIFRALFGLHPPQRSSYRIVWSWRSTNIPSSLPSKLVGGNGARVQRGGLPLASLTAVAAVARAVEGVVLDREFVLLRGLIEIAQRCMQRTFITDEKGTAIKVRGAGRRGGASGRVRGEGGDGGHLALAQLPLGDALKPGSL